MGQPFIREWSSKKRRECHSGAMVHLRFKYSSIYSQVKSNTLTNNNNKYLQ